MVVYWCSVLVLLWVGLKLIVSRFSVVGLLVVWWVVFMVLMIIG